MKITYDKQADAAYVMIAGRIHDGEAATQLHSIETPGGNGLFRIEGVVGAAVC